MYYPCSENKGADQLRGYREADLRLCFRICKKPVFSERGSFVSMLSFLLKVPSLINGSIAHRENYFVLIYNITGFLPRGSHSTQIVYIFLNE